MAQVGALIDFVASTKIVSADVDQNFADLRTGVNAALFVDESRNVEDNVQVRFGTAGRYWFEYNSAGSAFRMRTTDSDGGGTDGTVFSVANGGVAVAFSGQVSATVLSLGTTAAAAGNVRLPNNTSVRWRNAANTGDLYLLLNGSDSMVVNTTFHPATDASHSLGVGTYRWLDAYLSGSVRVGSTVATDGAIRLENNSPIRWRNAANSGNITGLNLNSSDQLAVGAVFVPGSDNALDLGTGSLRWRRAYLSELLSVGGSGVATAGAVRLVNNNSIAWRNAANSANVTLTVDASDNLVTTADIYAPVLVLGSTAAASGNVRLPNNSGIYWRNAANSADFGLYFDTSNDFRLEADFAPSTDSAFNFGTPTFRWLGGYFDAIDATQITGTLQTASQTNITGVGTITTGTWQGTAVASTYVGNLPTSKITSGTFADARISQTSVTQHQAALAIAASQVTSGVLATARLGTGTASSSTWLRGDGTWQTIPGGVSQLTDLSDVSAAGVTSGNVLVANGSTYAGRALAASDIASGTFASARISEASVTQHQAALSIGATQLTGTIASARISGSYTGITAVGTLSSLTVSGALSAASLNLGSDTITDMLIQHEVGLNFGASVAAGSESSQVTVTVTGAAVGDVVYASLNANSTGLATADRIGVHARVSAANSVVVWCYNGKGTSEDMSDYDVDIILIKD